MKKCKNPQCLTEMSENAPAFCPEHNSENLSSDKQLNWENGFDDRFGSFITNNDYHSNAIKHFISSLLSAQREELKKKIEAMKIKWQRENSLKEIYRSAFNQALSDLLKELGI